MTQTDLNWHKHPEEELRVLLEQAGYENHSIDEIEETVRVIFGAMAGSKGVIMDGQTDWLEVVNVELQR